MVTSPDPPWDGRNFERGEYPWAVDPGTIPPNESFPLRPYEAMGENEIGFTSLVDADQSKAIVAVVGLQDRSELLTSPVKGGSIQVVTHEDGSVVFSKDLNRINEQHFLADNLKFMTVANTQTRIDRVSTQTHQVNGSEIIVASAPVRKAR